MFTTTFLGHQGWLIGSSRASILVDPLLCEDFGQTHALSYRVWPPRLLRPEALPPIDAVVLTHEHDDHFDIPSLARIDRRVPVYLSARSSAAAYKILRQMGFTVAPLVPGDTAFIGDLRLFPLWADHENSYNADEWDALPFLVAPEDGHGSFFTCVDVELTPAQLQAARQRVAAPGLVTFTNNALDWSHVYTHQPAAQPEEQDAAGRFAQLLDMDHRNLSSIWGAPAATLVCAGGFSFCGEREWLNGRVFYADMERACQATELLYPRRRTFATRPGQRFHMREGRLAEVEESTPFLATAPRESWPSRARRDEAPRDYGPATGKRELGKKDLHLLGARLGELARALVGSVLFKSLYSLPEDVLGGRLPTFALVLRNGGERFVLEYNPNGCSFEPGRAEGGGDGDGGVGDGGDAARGLYLAGMECWASDLSAVLGGELGQIALTFGRSLIWNALPQHFNFSLADDLQRVSHPLSHPVEYFRLYERQLRALGPVQPIILPR